MNMEINHLDKKPCLPIPEKFKGTIQKIIDWRDQLLKSQKLNGNEMMLDPYTNWRATSKEWAEHLILTIINREYCGEGSSVEDRFNSLHYLLHHTEWR